MFLNDSEKMPPIDRFTTSKRTLFIDHLMNHLIRFGGASLIVIVLGIFVFIFYQIVPLFKGAQVKHVKSVNLPQNDYQLLGLDEWAEKPFVVSKNYHLFFADIAKDGLTEEANWPGINPDQISTLSYIPEPQIFIFGTHQGEFGWITLDYQPQFQNDLRTISYELNPSPLYSLADMIVEDGTPAQAIQRKILNIQYGGQEDHILLAMLVSEKINSEENKKLFVVRLNRESSLLGKGEFKLDNIYDLTTHPITPLIAKEIANIHINSTGDILIVGTTQGELHYFSDNGNDLPQLKQTFKPFGDLDNPQIVSFDFIFGGVSLFISNPMGINRLFSLYIPERTSPVRASPVRTSPVGTNQRIFGMTNEFSPLKGEVNSFSASFLNKAFLVTMKNEDQSCEVSLRFSTTGETRWEEKLPFEIRQGVISRKYQRLVFLDNNSHLHLYALNDPHPEGGFKAFFSKIWYEGFSKPDYAWQSTGGKDDFEPKLSLIPLIIGTLKGTLYALLFALPIALLAAIYSAEFLHPKIKTYFKPLMEMMASLPSVILGFLAALWLAPLLETRVPSLFCILILVPMVTLLVGTLWSRLGSSLRAWLPQGFESFLLIPILLLTVVLSWKLGPYLESLFFVVTDLETGQKVADFRLWWPEVTGSSFEQRNSLVVGFIMGFAVIPIIYTITDDSLSSVPLSLRSASLACGASRWQTAFRVVLPAAVAGIFSAIMIGLGRAVGETMIVLMATGNTPIMDFNIFSGMRTLAANIAVELPEAPHHGTLYRTLFLGAFVLFMITFVVNTVAEVLRQYLRERHRM